jgi:SAM-dependent MidA family methyltransferase
MNKAQMKKCLITKAKWALFSRKECTKHVDDISSFANELIASFPADRAVKKREQLCEADAAALAQTDGDVAALLKEALGKDDEQMKGAMDRAVQAGHQNIANFTGDGNKGL